MSDALAMGREWLMAQRHVSGGWPYRPGQPPAIEPTCLATLALGAAVDSAWLRERVQGDGSVTMPEDADPHWGAGLTVMALMRRDEDREARERVMGWLLTSRGEQARREEEVRLDPKLSGWPWMMGSFSWVEPTSQAVLALKMAGHGGHARVKEAEAMLLDRECGGGGWNYGNSTVLGASLVGFMDTTAWAIMALRDVEKAGPALERGEAFLQKESRRGWSVLTASLAALATVSLRGEAAAFLHRRQMPEGSWRGQIHLTAWAMLGLTAEEGGGHVFGA